MKAKPQLNMNKAALYAIVINALQIISALALAAMILLGGASPSLQRPMGKLIVAALTVVVCWGAFMDIREAVRARKMGIQLRGLDETVTQMSDLNRALRAQRHDFLNHLQVVYSLIEMKEYEEANRYIEQVYGDIQQVSKALKTACPPLNALLRAKMAEAEQKNVRVELTVHAAWDDLPLPAWEMCRVLSNLIDNALDALAGAQDPTLWIDLKEDVRGFSFTVKNNGPAIPRDRQSAIFEAGVSGKGEGRGMGLFIARETLRQAGGDLTVESDERFTAFSGQVPRSLQTAEQRKEAAP